MTIQKLGWGHFSTVWLARDFKHGTYVAIKVQKSASHYLEAAYDEVELLQKAAKYSTSKEWETRLREKFGVKGEITRDNCHVVQLLNAFIYEGPYGNHFCMVFEILGVNLLEIIKKYEYKGCPINLCRKIARQTLIGLDYLHNVCGIIHTDLKPENVLLMLTQQQINDIVESGQLKRSPKHEEKIRELQDIFSIISFTDIIRECKIEWGEDISSRTANVGDLQTNKRKNTEISQIDFDEGFDPDTEYERIIKENGNKMNRKDKKNLRKKLKKKASRMRKRYGADAAPIKNREESTKLDTEIEAKVTAKDNLNIATPANNHFVCPELP